MRYTGQVIRPPSESKSYLLQITYGCSWNRGTFCPAYLDKPFKIRPIDQPHITHITGVFRGGIPVPGVRPS